MHAMCNRICTAVKYRSAALFNSYYLSELPKYVFSNLCITSPHGIAMPPWFFLSFFQRLISEVTERISTKLGHIFTYDCYLKSLVKTPPGIYPTGCRANKRFFGDRLWTLTEHISVTEHDINNREKNLTIYRDSPTCPTYMMNFGPETAENGWRVFVHPLNFRIGRQTLPCI